MFEGKTRTVQHGMPKFGSIRFFEDFAEPITGLYDQVGSGSLQAIC